MAEVPGDDTPRQQASGDHSPSLRELDQLPVAAKWHQLGLILGVSDNNLEKFKKKYPRDAEICKIKMFAEWLRGDTNPTYEKLVRALANVRERKLAESICSAQGISQSFLEDIKLHQSHEDEEDEPPFSKRPQLSPVEDPAPGRGLNASHTKQPDDPTGAASTDLGRAQQELQDISSMGTTEGAVDKIKETWDEGELKPTSRLELKISDTDKDDGTRVEESTLPRLLGVLSPVVHIWKLFALSIGVPSAEVSLIEAANHRPSSSSLYNCFSQSLEWWVANNHNPTYEAILAVLDPKSGETTPVMNRNLAKQVKDFMAKERGTIEEESTSSQIITGPVTVDDYTKQNVMVIQGKFGKLLQTVRKYLQKKMKKKQIEAEDLRLFILQLFPNISPDLIPHSSDLNEIFEAMRRNRLWSYMNYFSLEQVVKQFCSDKPEMTSKMEKFKKDRAGFQLATKIKVYIPAAKICEREQLNPVNPVNPDHFTKLSYKLDECVADYSLKYLEELWQSLSFHMQLPPITLLFEIIGRGCIQIVFLVPTRLVDQVIHQAQCSAYYYRQHHIRSVTVGDNCIYNSLDTVTKKQVIPDKEEPILVQTKGGYNCEFVQPPPAGLETKCHVCLQIPREPHMVTCCSNRFCESCIIRIKVDGECCPLCKATTFDSVHDKKLQRSLKGLKVHCVHSESGCEWTGELGLLDKHLNVNPESKTLLEGCGYSDIVCIHCGHPCRRNLFTNHQIEECEKRPNHRVTAEDICQGIPSERLDSPVTDVQIADLASELKMWEELAPYLGLTPADEEEIQVNYQGRYGLQKRQALRKWQLKVGRGPHGATYRNFIIALCRAKETEMAVKVRILLTTSATDHVLETFHKYLVDCYTIAQHPAQIQWPFSRLSSYIELTLVQATDTQTPPSGQEERAQPLKEVQLTELFHVGSHWARRKVVLIEGPAGCGKTTLLWHICREWAAGRLFQQFSLLINVSLEDDTLFSAKCLADLIPHESSELREAVARGIYEQRGKGVCFLFNAWDKAPPALHGRKSYLHKFITGSSTRMLPRCSIVVTSRPAAASLLYRYLTARVNIRGFGATKLKEFIHASLEDRDSRQKLLQQLRELPQVSDLCNLPINAAIVVHLFHHSPRSTLPSTSTGLFKALVCNLLVRYMQLQTHHGLLAVKELEHLPDDVLQDFGSVCDLAFRGIMEDRKVFYAESLQKLGLKHPSSPLGLMQAQQQLTGFGTRHCYSFFHYAVQEFLAAYHISKLSEKEQTKVVREILHRTPLSTVLPFYAGLTKLLNRAARDSLLKVTQQPLDTYSVTTALSHVTQSGDKRRLVLALFNCIYESQNPSICALVKPPRATHDTLMAKALFPSSTVAQFRPSPRSSISFACLGLDPVDCLSIGYFIRHASAKVVQVNIDLQQCCISDTEVGVLVRQVQGSETRVFVYLQLDYNIMSHRAIESLSDTMSMKSSVLVGISLTGCWHPAITDIKLALKYLIEGVSRSKSLETLALEECYLSSAHTYHLALLASVGNIKILDLSSNNVRSAIPFIAEATKHNRLQRLHVFNCCISDKELMLLGKALHHNTVMHMTIFGNLFSLGALSSLLIGLIGSNSVLIKLGVDRCSYEQRCIVETINSSRKQKPCARKMFGFQFNTIPDLKVEPFIPTWKMGAEMQRTLRTLPPYL